MDKTNSVFDSALWAISASLKNKLYNLDDAIKKETYEIRLRCNRPVMLYGKYKSMFLEKNSTVSAKPGENTCICSFQEITDTFNRICGYSIHTHQQDINNGFVTVKGGHRVGICGTAVCNGQGEIVSIKDITSLNIRIARNISGCSDEIVKRLLYDGDKSIIIAGAPSSGKTTLLKDLAASLSQGRNTAVKKVALIDERQELTNCFDDCNADVLRSYPKDAAIMCAIRTLSPEYIICDEVGNKADIDAVVQGVNTGVNFVVTVHSFDVEDFLQRPQTQSLLETKCFKKVVFLNSSQTPCSVRNTYDAEELLYEVYRRRVGVADDDLYRLSDFSLLQKQNSSA